MKLYLLFLLYLGLALFAGCGAKTDTTTVAGLEQVTLMLNWYPEAEHGGFYAAKVEGIYEKYGLDVEIRPGGPSAPVAQELVAGRVQFAIGNADDVLTFREQQAPVVALMAPIQNTPRCILVHEESNVQSLDGLTGLKLQAGAGRAYLEFMKSKGMLEGVQIVPYSGVPVFASDPKNAMQGYSFSEPLVAKQLDTKVRVMMVSEAGFNPYASCLIATDDYIASNSDIVKRMVQASREGWKQYFEDAQATNEAILSDNSHGMTIEALEFGQRELKKLCVTDEVPLQQIGAMNSQRWETLVDQFTALDLLDPQKVMAKNVFTDRFLDPSESADTGTSESEVAEDGSVSSG